MDIRIESVETSEQIELIRSLFLEYQASLGVDLCFQQFDEELTTLPASYAPPSGRLLLAGVDGIPCGCAALQAIDARTAEMKRLYVRSERRGLGLGRILADRIIADARSVGYQYLCLDTLPSMERAISLYRTLGFIEIPPYRFNPIPGARYMGLELR